MKRGCRCLLLIWGVLLSISGWAALDSLPLPPGMPEDAVRQEAPAPEPRPVAREAAAVASGSPVLPAEATPVPSPWPLIGLSSLLFALALLIHFLRLRRR